MHNQGGSTGRSTVLKQIYYHINQEFVGDDDLEHLSNLISYIKNMMIEPDDKLGHEQGLSKLSDVYYEYEKFKKENSLIDFDDMLDMALKIFKAVPILLQYYQEKYAHFSIDEAQDSSKIQHEIVRLVAAKSQSLFMVGDEDQSIYAFRGAYPEAILDFQDTYPNSFVLKMENNYRSNKSIVSRANQFIKQNKKRYDKEMFCDNDHQQGVSVIQLSDYADQYHIILEKILENGNLTTAIIYRNNESAVPLADMFERNHIDFYVKEHNASFIENFVVRDVLSFIRLAYDPSDIKAFSQIYYKLYLSKMMFEFAKQRATQYDNVFEVILTIHGLEPYLKARLKNFIKNFSKIKSKSPYHAIRFIEENLGYNTYLKSRANEGYVLENMCQKLNILKSIALHYKNTLDFVGRLTELEDVIKQSAENKSSNITLTTMHSSKGLEFDRVFLIDLVEGQIPSSLAIQEKMNGNADLMEEDVRLFYVSATRARQELILFKSNSSNNEKAYPSRFVSNFFYGLKPQQEVQDIKQIDHTLYGKGMVVSMKNNDIAVVQFDCGIKEISLSYCIENNKINII
jgi:DNA helicase-2/ATP-dependent DNA helicase PcrA